jgi:hypothetical protein
MLLLNYLDKQKLYIFNYFSLEEKNNNLLVKKIYYVYTKLNFIFFSKIFFN